MYPCILRTCIFSATITVSNFFERSLQRCLVSSCANQSMYSYAENMYVYFLPPSQSQVSLREVLARKRNLTPTHSLNVCQPVGVEKMANNLYNVWLDIALVKTFLLIVSNWLVASLFPFFSSGNCYSGRSPLLLTSRYECATTIIIIIAIIRTSSIVRKKQWK